METNAVDIFCSLTTNQRYVGNIWFECRLVAQEKVRMNSTKYQDFLDAKVIQLRKKLKRDGLLGERTKSEDLSTTVGVALRLALSKLLKKS